MTRAFSLKTRVITISSKSFALHLLKGTQLRMRRNEIFCIYTVTLPTYSRSYQMLDPPLMVKKAIQDYEDLE